MRYLGYYAFAPLLGLIVILSGCSRLAPPPPDINDELMKAQEAESKKVDEAESKQQEAGNDE